MLKISICKMSLKNILVELQAHLSGANELSNIGFITVHGLNEGHASLYTDITSSSNWAFWPLICVFPSRSPHKGLGMQRSFPWHDLMMIFIATDIEIGIWELWVRWSYGIPHFTLSVPTHTSVQLTYKILLPVYRTEAILSAPSPAKVGREASSGYR